MILEKTPPPLQQYDQPTDVPAAPAYETAFGPEAAAAPGQLPLNLFEGPSNGGHGTYSFELTDPKKQVVLPIAESPPVAARADVLRETGVDLGGDVVMITHLPTSYAYRQPHSDAERQAASAAKVYVVAPEMGRHAKRDEVWLMGHNQLEQLTAGAKLEDTDIRVVTPESPALIGRDPEAWLPMPTPERGQQTTDGPHDQRSGLSKISRKNTTVHVTDDGKVILQHVDWNNGARIVVGDEKRERSPAAEPARLGSVALTAEAPSKPAGRHRAPETGSTRAGTRRVQPWRHA